ncbi:DUF452 family protein [Sulfurospirillum sp. T05]|uniref:DUF452 family protein n=1 Tax=Sulfurospirillum tamanense TaxID=2813362 RepID=A0ABS2WTF6_9BACT|nr:pimeloyl-ACP methyl esterase BioG family protein [Sulfurospirillum tamanensis]MBN2964937.1 DUF452 family protein [Sulfurospirillum tamanensis]
MQTRFLAKGQGSHVAVFFAGWGMDERPFEAFNPLGKDLLVCFDYRSVAFDEALLTPYESIGVVGWSMGVWAACACGVLDDPRVVRSLAFNGTPTPVDDAKGIASAVFEGTLAGLNEITLEKFTRRMCGNGYEKFKAHAPKRSLESLREELAWIGAQECVPCPWDEAMVGRKDRIFTPQNQRAGWEGLAKVYDVDASHYDKTVLEDLLARA